MGLFIKKETKLLGLDLINNSKNWEQTDCTYSNGKLSLWTENIPVLNLDSYPGVGMFNIFEKFYIHRCIKISKINKALNFKP